MFQTLGMHFVMYVVHILSLLEDLCLFEFRLGYKYFLVQCSSLRFPPPAGYKTLLQHFQINLLNWLLLTVQSSGLHGLRVSLCLRTNDIIQSFPGKLILNGFGLSRHSRNVFTISAQAFQWIFCMQAINSPCKEVFLQIVWAIYCPPKDFWAGCVTFVIL